MASSRLRLHLLGSIIAQLEMMRILMFLKNAFIIFIFSFVAHFGWEWLQCQAFFVHSQSAPNLSSMIMATLGDVLLTFIIIGIVALSCPERYSIKLNLKKLVICELLSFVLATAVEKYALSEHRWAYTHSNPVIPFLNVSILPILQLMLLTPLIVILAEFFIKRVSSR